MTETQSNKTETRTLVIEREMPHSADKIWRALTEGSLISQWLLANDFKPVVGHRFQFKSTPMPQWNGIIDSEVLTIEPQHRLVYSWNVGSSETSMGTVVTWTLTPTSGGVMVRMEQAGFRADQENNYRGAEWGWKKFIGGLEKVAGELA